MHWDPTVYKWAAGVLAGLVVSLASYIGGSLTSAAKFEAEVEQVSADLREHESATHGITGAQLSDIIRRLDRIENKLDR